MKHPKILIWDLETAGVNAFYADLGVIVNFGYKWLGEKLTHCLLASDYRGWFVNNQINDEPLVRAALRIMGEADLLVAHFGDKFDRRFFNARCAVHGLEPPPPIKQRDTWKILKGAFRFRSNRLLDAAMTFGLEEQKHQKTRDEWPGWWMRAMGGSASALREMAEYCKQDVRTLEQLYLKIRAYDNQQHPLFFHSKDDRTVCGYCGSAVQYRGVYYAGKNKYRKYVCKNRVCMRWGREGRAISE